MSNSTPSATCPTADGVSDFALLTELGADLYAALDKGERSCVSRKIKILADEGYDDPKQRVAIAIKHCAPGKARKSKHAAELFQAVGVTVESTVEQDIEEFAAWPKVPQHYDTVEHSDGRVTVKDVPIFGENEREGLGDQGKYDAKWLAGACEKHKQLASHSYFAPMHFGHHSFSGHPVERAGHIELSKVCKHKHLGEKKQILFAHLHFKDRGAHQRYMDHPYRSVEVSHERPDQVNSLALLSSEAPYFQFPMQDAGTVKYGTDVAQAVGPIQAHYFTESFAPFPPKKAKPPKAAPPEVDEEAEDDQDEGDEDGSPFPPKASKPGMPPAPVDPGTNANDVGVALAKLLTGPIMELLNKLVDANLKGVAGNDEPDGDEPVNDQENDEDKPDEGEDDGAKKPMSDKKVPPVVAASADTATMEGKIAALEAEVTRLRKERENEQTFATLRAELSTYGIANLDAELRKRVDNGTAVNWADGIKQLAPPTRRNESPTQPLEDPAIGAFIKAHPKADAAKVRYLAEVYAQAEGSQFAAVQSIRKVPLERFIEVQLDMDRRS